MKVLSNHQHDLDWWDARKGKVTGSRVADVLSFLKRGEKKGGDTADRMAYKVRILTETLLGAPVMDGFLTAAMQWGVENEDLARADYEMATGHDVEVTGFLLHDRIDRFGGSPDGLVGNDGIVEFKCPNTTTHIKWVMADVVPPEHEPQCMSYLSITGRSWCDFSSFDPRLSARYRRFTKRLYRDENRIKVIEDGVAEFLGEVDELLHRVMDTMPEPTSLKAKLRASLDDPEPMITDEDLPAWARRK